jgi:hypothetical protein
MRKVSLIRAQPLIRCHQTMLSRQDEPGNAGLFGVITLLDKKRGTVQILRGAGLTVGASQSGA